MFDLFQCFTDKEEGISIPRSTPARPNLAKSLPMNIPAFIAKPRQGSGEEVDDASVCFRDH